MNSIKKRKNLLSKIKNINPIMTVLFAVLIVYAVSIVFVLAWGFLTSLKSVEDFSDMGNVLGLPNAKWSSKQILFRNYSLVLKSFTTVIQDNSYISSIFGKISFPRIVVTFWDLLFNTLMYAVVGSVIHAFTTMTVAYICAKYKYTYTKLIYYVCLIIMMIPIVGAYPSEIKLLSDLGLYNTYLGMWFQKLNFTGIYFFVFYGFFSNLSNTYTEAAEIDGASQINVYIRIIIPLAIKIIGTVILITFIQYYNNYQAPLLYFPSKPTISYGVFAMSLQTFNANPGQKTSEIQSAPVRIAGCMILALPILVIFLALKDVLMGNITIGGIKE